MRSVIRCLIFSLIGILNAYSQLSVKGMFCTPDKKPIEYALITFYQNDTTIVKQAFTNIKGEFEVEVAKGTYTIQAQTLGTRIYNNHVDIADSMDLGSIIVDPNIELKEVEVVYKKKVVERKIDRIVFNVENSSISLSGDAFDALKVTPNVRVENDAISIVGKSTLQVMLNGNMVDYSGDDLINYLKTISSDRIKTIEIITNPPSKYEAEGNSGLINIVLKRNKKESWDGAARAVYSQATYPLGSFFENLNFSIGKLSLSNNVSYGMGSAFSEENMNTYTDKQVWNQCSKIKSRLDNLSINLAAEYEISSKWLIGANYSFIRNVPKVTHNNIYNFINNITLQADSSSFTKSLQNGMIKNNSYNMYSKIQLDTLGKDIDLTLNYFDYANNADRNLNTYEKHILTDNVYNGNNQSINNFSGKVDISLPYSWGKISFGGKISFFETKNNASQIEMLKIYSNNTIFDQFNYKEKTQAVYLSFNKSFFQEKLDFQVGLRTEFTQTIGKSVSNQSKDDNHYHEFFPTAYVLYNLNSQSEVSFSYGRRINRPSFSYLNPFRWISNPHYYSEGNPFLKPSFSNNIEFNYVKGNWYNSLYYYDINDGFGQITTIVNKDSQKTTFVNYFKSYEFGILESYNVDQLKWLSSYNTINISYINSHSFTDITDYRLSGFNVNFSTSNDIYLNLDKTFIVNINYWYYFKGVTDLKKYSALGQLDIGVKLLLAKKKLQLSLSFDDIFKSNYPLYTRYTNQTKVTYKNYYDLRGVTLSLTYKFGGSVNKRIHKKDFGEQEEEKRVSFKKK